MEQVIITVKRQNEAQARCLEVPVDLPGQELAAAIAQALKWDIDAAGQRLTYEVEAYPPGRVMHPTETLAQVGVWDGAWLVLRPYAAWLDQPAVPGTIGGTVNRWQPLDPSGVQPVPPSEVPASLPGFVWKRVDQD